MKMIQNVSISVQQFHEMLVEALKQEYIEESIVKGTKFMKGETETEIVACSNHHVQLVTTYPEGKYFRDFQADALDPVTTLVEINESFEAHQFGIQLLALSYECLFQFRTKKALREQLKQFEQKIIQEKNL